MNEILNILSHKSGTPMKKGGVRILSFWAKGLGLLLLALFAISYISIAQTTLYSYQPGNWNNAATWTTDPSGTTSVGAQVPANGNIVVILTSRTVTLTADVATTGLDITINSGGFLDQTTFRFTSTLAALRGDGTLKLASVNFPAATTNTFVNTGGGTTEFYNTASFTFPAAQATYNNLTLNSNGFTATQLSNITLNGNLYVKQGTFRINNDATATRLNLTINGNVLVDNGASITVGHGSTNTTTSPLSINTTWAAPFINYYEQFHRVVINGDFTNNGTVRFTNLAFPVFDAFPPLGNVATSGAASVYFRGASDNTLTCNGTTDFYNLIVDKGIDQTYKLNVYSTAYPNFRLFGANIAGGNGGGNNPNLKKALWIRTGTLVLKGLTIIPSLSEGTCATETPGADPNTDFYIPANAALVLDGPDVVVLSTADDYREVNVAYNVTGGTGQVNGVGQGGCSSYSIYGKLQINDGFFSTRESGGFITWDVASGEFIINGGIVDAKQFRAAGGAGGLASFTQTGGLFILRGRFQRTPAAYTVVSDLTNVSTATLNTTRATEPSLDGSVGTFNINSTANVFTMSGGTIRIYDVCRAATPNYAFQVNSSTANINVTGGTVELIPTSGTGTADVDLPVSTTAPINNLTIARASGTRIVQLNTALTILNNLSITSGALTTNNNDVIIGGNFNLATGTIYTPGANTTTFNGTGTNTFTIEGTVTAGFTNLVMDKNSGSITLSRATPTSFAVSNTFDLLSGTFNDGGNTLTIAGNVTNSGTHTGSGAIVLNDTNGAQTIGGDGTGTFQNLTLNNTNGVNGTSQVSLISDITVNGVLNLQNDRIFNISSHRLSLGASATISGTFGAQRFIATDGNAGDKGILKTFSTNSFTFPIGVIPTAVRYTPTTISFSSTPTIYGTISVTPVDAEQMQTSANGKNRSLTYFWRVRSSGFTLGSATVSQTFTYNTYDVVSGGNVNETEYVPARYNPLNYTWNKGVTTNINTTTKLISWPNNVNYIDGDYTAGDDSPIAQDPFGTVTVYYSYQSGAWTGNSTWMTDTTNVSSVITQDPDKNTPIMIRNGHTITCDAPGNLCGSLQIQSTGILDCGTYTGLNFGIVSNHVHGSGKIMISRNAATTAFPSGDFSDFLGASGGTIEYYAPAGQSYNIPTTTGSGDALVTYRHLIVTPSNAQNITMPNLNLTIYGNFTSQGAGTARLNSSANSRTLTINGNLSVSSGTLQYRNGAVQSVVVNGDVIVTGATFSVRNNNSGISNLLSISGNLINNGIVNFSPGTNDYCDIIFNGSGNTSITGTSGTTTFNNLTVNKGVSQAVTLTIDVAGTLTTPVDNWLTLQNGTLRYMRTNPSSDFTISQGTAFTIPATAGLYIDYSNTGARNILIANNGVNTNDLYLNGKLTLVNGNVYIGPINGTTVNNNDIEYSGAGFSEIEVQGGNLVVNGQIRRNPATNAGILSYTQSGGNVIINGQNAIPSNAKLEILNAGSAFNMSGNSTLTIVRGGGGSTFGDLYLRPETSTVTGGTIIFTQTPATGPVVDAVQSYLLDATVPLNNLIITGKTAATTRLATVNLMVNPLVLNGTLTLSNAQSILTSNNIDISIKGDLSNSGTYNYGTNLTTFNGDTQSITGSSTTNFYDLTINPVTSVTLTRDVTINHDLTLSSGSLIGNTFNVNVKGNVTNNANYTGDNLLGGVILNGTSEQHISGTGTFGRLELNNAAGARLDNNITLQKNLKLTQGILDINRYLLSLGQSSTIEGTGFGTTKMITSDGVFSNVGLRKYIGTGATTFTFPIGVAGKYTPANLTVTANSSVGSIRINNINDHHPAVTDPSNVLKYYWEVESSGISGFSGNLLFNYLQGDVQGLLENQYVAARLIVPGTSWSKAATGSSTDNVDETNNKITFTYSGADNLSGEYTAGTDAAIPLNVPVYTSNADGNWTDQTKWTPSPTSPPCPSGGPNGAIVIINHVITTNQNYCFAYRTTINNKLIVGTSTYGHNLGTVDGSGTLYLTSGLLPAGRYTAFLSCSNTSTLEYGGTGSYSIIADLYDNVTNLVFSGTGTRILPDKDLVICNQLLINGPTLDNSTYNRKLTIQGSMNLASGAFNSGSGDGATVSFAGSASQTVANFAGTNTFNNLEINNSAGLTLNSPIDVKGTLLLTNGPISSSAANKLTINNTAISCVTPAGGTASSYVNGPLAKKINQGDNFIYPIGKGNVLGNRLTLLATQTGTLVWTAEYFRPNSTATSVTSPLTATNADEYWAVTVPTAGSQAKINLGWNSSSGLTPLMTQNGITDMRVAEYNTTTSSWVEIASTNTGDNYNGSSETSSRVTLSTGTRNYTLASAGTMKPRAKLDPTGPVCGTAGIPVTFTTSIPINLNYTINYTIGGVAQTPVTVTSLPFNLPTIASGGVYQLTGFTYNNGSGTGVVDAGTVSVYAVPTTANAGPDQTGMATCGATSATLNGNDPSPYSGLWTIVSGTGGTIVTPTVRNSQFNGTNGSTYTLRWTIANGTCTSSDDMVITFNLLPSEPSNFTGSSSAVCQGQNGVAYVVPNDPTVTYNWSYGGTGATINGTSNSVTVDFSSTATSGTLGVTATNGCGTSVARNIAITVNPMPAVTNAATASTCSGTGPNISLTASVPSNFAWTIGTITGGITGASAGSGSTINQVLTNPSNTIAGTVQYLVTPASTTGSCTGTAYTITVTVNPAPGQPAAFTTSTNVLCQGTNNVIYTVPNDATVAYTWSYTVGTGATITGTTNSVTVNYSNTATSGTLNVFATNGCSTSAARTLAITVNPLPATGPVYRKPNN